MQYKTFSLDEDEDPESTLDDSGSDGWRLVSAVSFMGIEYDHDGGHTHQIRKIRYIMEKSDTAIGPK